MCILLDFYGKPVMPHEKIPNNVNLMIKIKALQISTHLTFSHHIINPITVITSVKSVPTVNRPYCLTV